MNFQFSKRVFIWTILIIAIAVVVVVVVLIINSSKIENETSTITSPEISGGTQEKPTTLQNNLAKTPVPGSCLVLEERYCKSGKLIPSSVVGEAIAFKLPKDTPIFAPYGGEMHINDIRESETSKRFPFYSIYRDIYRDSPTSKKLTEMFSAVFIPSPQKEVENPEYITKGAIIAYLSDEKASTNGDFNLIISFMKQGAGARPDEWGMDSGTKRFFNL